MSLGYARAPIYTGILLSTLCELKVFLKGPQINQILRAGLLGRNIICGSPPGVIVADTLSFNAKIGLVDF